MWRADKRTPTQYLLRVSESIFGKEYAGRFRFAPRISILVEICVGLRVSHAFVQPAQP